MVSEGLKIITVCGAVYLVVIFPICLVILNRMLNNKWPFAGWTGEEETDIDK